MKKIGLLVVLMAAAVGAQTASDAASAIAAAPEGTVATSANFPIQRVQMPTYADVYCSGFINRQSLPDANYVVGPVLAGFDRI